MAMGQSPTAFVPSEVGTARVPNILTVKFWKCLLRPVGSKTLPTTRSGKRKMSLNLNERNETRQSNRQGRSTGSTSFLARRCSVLLKSFCLEDLRFFFFAFRPFVRVAFYNIFSLTFQMFCARRGAELPNNAENGATRDNGNDRDHAACP